MKRLKHIVILDPIPFAGGSKVSTKHILSQLESKPVRISILTSDPDTWAKTQAYVKTLYMPKQLEKTEQGLSYFTRHFLIALQLLWLRLFVGRMDTALAASGPGVDLGLYLARFLLGYRLVQMVHGPVARSRTIGRCLLSADEVYYLDSTRDSLNHAISATGSLEDVSAFPQFQTFRNGLPKALWPTRCQYDYAVLFWAASLLKWKGLDTLTKALSHMTPSERPETHICFIRPKQTNLAVSNAPQCITKVFWHEAPEKLDGIRARSNIFVSTSTKEPFGLSILEAMAAGMCVIIPSDGAYWDTQLTDGENCLKYLPDDEADLARTLAKAQQNMQSLKELGEEAFQIARQYRAELCFSAICDALTQQSARNDAALARDEVQG
ncbi:glycosyltransferase [Grimontia sp. AD028]|uniref:glycosyltransferase family 4 protein n=1 Tax=Grimontia sp. AD028 TaxID=1581149 RepID=UPI00061B202B|nr:glycosyltransferase family 4 protein [Grimontia sp. AD028]KKD60202.1 glycosyltransferase [Grimontia sp. AD028]